MDANHLQDRVYWGLNRIANIMGRETDAYRSTGPVNPIERSNRYLRLLAAFSRADGNFAQSVSYGAALWRGHFDASYSRVGDYLVQDDKIWFIAAQQSLLPVLCVKTNHVISIARQTVPTTGSSSDPVNASSMTTIISQWPASLLGTGTEGKPPTHLPGDTIIPNVIALLPSIHGQIVQPTDIITDENGSNSIVVAAELSDLGWRLNIRQVST
jgi:hypothetical protein